jgi:hypothetical protein
MADALAPVAAAYGARAVRSRLQELVVAKELSQAQLRELALVGARARLDELRRQEDELRGAFPELFRGGGRGRRGGAAAGIAAAAKTRRRPKMSAAARKAVSERMTKYWADRRKQQGQKAGK